MRAISALAISCAIALPAHAQQQQQIAAPTLFSIRGGETLLLRAMGWITAECVSTFVSLEGIDVLDGPPEVSLKFEPGQVNLTTTAGKICPKPLPGGNIMITASKDITDQKEVNLTLRVRVKTKQTSGATATMRYHLLLFPAPSGATGEPAKQ
jgi:hypothetical protein